MSSSTQGCRETGWEKQKKRSIDRELAVSYSYLAMLTMSLIASPLFICSKASQQIIVVVEGISSTEGIHTVNS
ncbi:unnamed protein product [Arabis nemorensis]|uniref:Uncharacterized protein n=1 Tax=Arabis nemorensis TaxID=586526 RepID=A0A565C4K2_9BRAS|nr:unnamed protein product [Arabis nemorensis]